MKFPRNPKSNPTSTPLEERGVIDTSTHGARGTTLRVCSRSSSTSTTTFLGSGALWPMPAWVWRDVRSVFFFIFFHQVIIARGNTATSAAPCSVSVRNHLLGLSHENGTIEPVLVASGRSANMTTRLLPACMMCTPLHACDVHTTPCSVPAPSDLHTFCFCVTCHHSVRPTYMQALQSLTRSSHQRLVPQTSTATPPPVQRAQHTAGHPYLHTAAVHTLNHRQHGALSAPAASAPPSEPMQVPTPHRAVLALREQTSLQPHMAGEAG